jgi:hypothetical protein
MVVPFFELPSLQDPRWQRILETKNYFSVSHRFDLLSGSRLFVHFISDKHKIRKNATPIGVQQPSDNNIATAWILDFPFTSIY